MRNLITVSLLLCIWLPVSSAAQTLSNKEKRRINTKLLEAIEQYESNATIYDENAKYAFLELCDSNALIYCDLLDQAAGKKIPAAEYADLLHSKENVSMEIKNVRRDPPFWKDGAWYVNVNFAKSVVYNDKNAVLYSSAEYYKSDYDISVEFVYDRKADCCRIVSVDGTIASQNAPLPEHYVVINRTSPLDDRLWCGKRHPEFNSFDQAFAPAGSIRSWHDDVRIKADTIARTQSYDFVQFRYRKTSWRGKLRAGFTVGSAFKLTSPVNFNTENSSAFEVGVDVGYALPLGKSVSLSIYTGAALSTSKIELGLNNLSYSYDTGDRHGTAYSRCYDLESVTEGVSYTDIVIPVYLSLDHKLSKNLGLSWHVGAKIYMNGSAKVTPFHIKGEVYGNYGGQTVRNQSENAFQLLDNDYDRFLYPNTYARNSTDMSLVGGLGLNYNILKQYLFLCVKFSYELGFTDVHKSNENDFFNAADQVYPMVYSARLKENVATRSFMDCVSYKRQAMWLEAGLMFKF